MDRPTNGMLNNIKVSFFLAFKAVIRGDKGSLLLTTLIMMVVFLNLLFVDAIFAGITRTMDKGKIDYQYGEVIIEPKTGDKYIKNTKDVLNSIRDFHYVKSLVARIQTSATVSSDKDKDGRNVASMAAGVVGVDTDLDNDVIDIKSHIVEGRYLNKDDYNKAIIGVDLAGGYGSSVFPVDLEGVRTGDSVDVKYEEDLIREYEIVGIYRTKNFDADSKIIITQRELNSVLGTTNEASEIIIRLNDKNMSKEAVSDFRNLNFGDYDISDWNDKLAFGRAINKSFDMIGTILRVIGSLVAGLVIFIIIFVDIVNRRKQIGILKAIGIPEGIIMSSYVIRGMFYTLIGVIIGYLVMRFGIITFFKGHPIDFPMGDMIPFIKQHSLLMSIILFTIAGFIGSFLPSVKEVHKKILFLMR